MAILVYFLLSTHVPDLKIAKMAAVTIWVAWWWLSEVIELSISALIPFVMLPLLGITDASMVANQYMDQIIFLFIGGFFIAFAIEKWDLHKRISEFILRLTGNNARQILAGIMLCTFFLSMWISNTATVMMMLSVVLALCKLYDETQTENNANFKEALLISLAFSATIGGMGTLVGTPTNMIFYSFYKSHYAETDTINFLNWMLFSLPIALILISVCFYTLIKYFKINKSVIIPLNKGKEAKPFSFEEKVVMVIFCLTAVLWFFRADIEIGSITIKGWSNLFESKKFITDSSVAILMSLILFLFPSRSKPGETILNMNDLKRLPIDIIFLFGGGFAIAKGFEISGLSNWITSLIMNISGLKLALFIFIIGFVITALSEFSSNVATIQLMLPVLMPFVTYFNIKPTYILIPATLFASLGFMLPVATAPNTIVYGTGCVKPKNMLKIGLIINLVGIISIAIWSLFAGVYIF